MVGRVLGLAVLVAAGWLAYAFAWPIGPHGESFVEIAPGTSSRHIAEQLARSGVVRSALAFDALRMIRGGTLKAGEYRFDHPARVGEVYERVARGDVYTIALTIPEGANLFDVAQRVEAAKLGSREEFLAEARRSVGLVRGLDPSAPSLEGYLFPVTYRFGRAVTAHQMLVTMVTRFRQEALVLGLEGGVSGGVHRVVTMASLVERETPIGAERPLVASVFENRLRQGMPLDTDPTVIYAALIGGRYRGTIYRSDLEADSEYNTYLHAGLPPGPICNPGEASLKAAMEPARTNYLYFVAAGADPQGHSRFAATLAEHQRNVLAYRRDLAAKR
jgi:UPF0755 protein